MSRRQDLIVSLLRKKLEDVKIGIIIKDIDAINPTEAVKSLSADIERKIYTVVIGYNNVSEADTDSYQISTDIEDAVAWRNKLDCAGSILVFIRGDVAKLHSLDVLDTISKADLVQFAIDEQIDKLQDANRTIKEFWEAIKDTSGLYSLSDLEEFIGAIEGADELSVAISKEMWRLSLLRDDDLLGGGLTSADRKQRIIANRNRLIDIAQISENGRRNLSRSLARASEAEKDVLQNAYRLVEEYMQYGQKNILQTLKLAEVEILMSATKPKALKRNKKDKQETPPTGDPTSQNDGQGPDNNTEGEGDTDTGGDGTGDNDEQKPLKKKDVDEIIIDQLLNGDESGDEDLENLYEQMGEAFSSDTQDKTSIISNIGGIFGDAQIEVDIPQDSLYKRVCESCGEDAWGGLLETKEKTLKEGLGSTVEIRPYTPDTVTYPNDNSSFYELLGKFDEVLNRQTKFKDIFDAIVADRKELAKYIYYFMYYPYLPLRASKAARDTLCNYVENWEKLYRLYNECEHEMALASSAPTTFVGKAIAAFDILYIKLNGNEWKGIMLPLHPLYLWPFYKVIKLLYEEKDSISAEDNIALKMVIKDPPQMLNYLAIDEGITGQDNKILPCSGTYQDILPIYEEDKSRFLGDNGIEVVNDTLESWLKFAPFTRNEIRIATVDAPNLVKIVRNVAAFTEKYSISKLVYYVFYTNGQNGNSELASMDYSEGDSRISDMIKSGRLLLNIPPVTSITDIQKIMHEKPVHVAYYFDQSKYKVDRVQDEGKLYSNPFVISYAFDYDKIEHKGTISPSSRAETGIVGDYHNLLVSTGYFSDNKSPWLQFDKQKSDFRMLSAIKNGDTQWMVIADLDLGNYKITNADELIPIGEKSYKRRVVGTWASSNSRIVTQYLKDLKEDYNLSPNRDKLVNMLKSFGHIAATGNISIPKIGFDNQATKLRQKGLLGTLFAARWYINRNLNNNDNVLIASLDSPLARIWLTKRTIEDDNADKKAGQERADLVGLIYDEGSDTLHIQVIEVKTRDENNESQRDFSHWVDEFGQNRLSGHAPKQIAKVIKPLNEIFILGDPGEKAFTSAKREVLKLQIITECFRNIHDEGWQEKWHNVLSRAFAVNKEERGGLRIDVSGVLVYIRLKDFNAEDSKPILCLYDDDINKYPIELSTLNSHDIQKYVFSDYDVSEVGDVNEAVSSANIGAIEATDAQEIVTADNSTNNTQALNAEAISEGNMSEATTEEVPNSAPFDFNQTVQIHNTGEKPKLDDVRLLLGEDQRTGEKFYWEFGNKKLSNRHLLINGNSGCGKTYCIEALLMEAALQGISSVVFDYTGGFTSKKLDPMFTEKMGDRVIQRVVRKNKIPINPFKRHEIEIGEGDYYPEENFDIAIRISETIASVYTMGDQQKNTVYQAALNGLNEYGEAMNFRILAEKMAEIGSSYAGTALSRIQQFIDINPFSEEESFNWADIRDSNGIVYIFQFMGYVRETQVMLTELLLWDLWNFSVKYGDESKPFIYVIDEAQNLDHGGKSPSGKILTEGRKNGLSGWYATQFMKPQLDDVEIQNLQQADQKLYFCPPGDGVMTVAKNIDINPQGARDWAERLTKLNKGECVTCGSMIRGGKWNKYDPRVIKITSFDKR